MVISNVATPLKADVIDFVVNDNVHGIVATEQPVSEVTVVTTPSVSVNVANDNGAAEGIAMIKMIVLLKL